MAGSDALAGTRQGSVGRGVGAERGEELSLDRHVREGWGVDGASGEEGQRRRRRGAAATTRADVRRVGRTRSNADVEMSVERHGDGFGIFGRRGCGQVVEGGFSGTMEVCVGDRRGWSRRGFFGSHFGGTREEAMSKECSYSLDRRKNA